MQHKHRTRCKKLASWVKEAKSLKNAARRELNRARKESSISQEQINSIAHKFFKSVRSHNKLTREYRHFQHKAKSKAARHQCHVNLWQFTKDLLEDKPVTNVHPTFSETEATSFFSKAYHSEPRRYTQPSWIPSATVPVAEFNEDDITLEEITLAVKKARSKSSPSPFDVFIPYIVFKKCPALLSALHNIFNLFWTCSTIPSAWKMAAVKLIAKSTAQTDPSLPSNFRPIALTSCVGKLFSTVI